MAKMKNKKRIIAVAVLALVLFTVLSLPLSALSFPSYAGYQNIVAFAGANRTYANASTKICTFHNVEIRTPYNTPVTEVYQNLEVYVRSNNNTVGFRVPGASSDIMWYGKAEGSIYYDGDYYSLVYLAFDNVTVVHALYTDLFIFPSTGSYESGFSDGFTNGYNKGYEEGYAAGYAQGLLDGASADFDKGYQAAVDEFNDRGIKNIFSFCTASFSWYDANDTFHEVLASPDVDGYSVRFTTLYQNLVNYCEVNNLAFPRGVGVGINPTRIAEGQPLYIPWGPNSLIEIVGASNNDLNYMFIDYPYDPDYPSETYDPIQSETIDGVTGWYGYPDVTFQLRSMYLDFSDNYQLPDIELYTKMTVNNESYSAGYIAGWNAGVTGSNTQQLVDDAYNRGFGIGFDEGKAEGLTIAEGANFYDLMYSVVQAPLDVLYGAFSFEILGFNVQSAIGAVCTLALLVVVVKIILFFL